MYQIGRTLRATRALLGITQLQMARRLGISEDTLSGLERNLHSPSVRILNQISRNTGISKEGLVLINMSAPKELSPECIRMFDKVQGELVKEFVSKQIIQKGG